MRRIFSKMEWAQTGFLDAMGIPPHDQRLRRLREGALKLFEQAWTQADPQDVQPTEAEFGILYLYCLAAVMEAQGIHVPAGTLPVNDKVKNIMKGVSA